MRKLYNHLLARSAEPYFSMLNTWLQRGQLRDAYGEFFICENTKLRAPGDADLLDSYWEKRYRLRPHAVPRFLEASQEKALLAGKYLNVLRECGRSATAAVEEEQEGLLDVTNLALSRSEAVVAMNGNVVLCNVELAYRRANSALLELLVNEHKLLPRLQ